MKHRHEVKVRFYELDPYNHVNHSSYIQYFEVGRIELLEEIGYGLAALQEIGRQLVVTELQTRFLASAGPRDRLVIETGVGRTRRVGGTWNQRLLRGDEVLATQTISFAVTDTDGRPRRMPGGLAAALAPYTVEGDG